MTLTVDADHLGPREESWMKRIEFSDLERTRHLARPTAHRGRAAPRR